MKFNKSDILYWINEIGYDPTNLSLYDNNKKVKEYIDYFNKNNLLDKFFNYCCTDIYDRCSSIDEWINNIEEIINNVDIKNIIKLK